MDIELISILATAGLGILSVVLGKKKSTYKKIALAIYNASRDREITKNEIIEIFKAFGK
jgi:hypothetical protein